MIELVRKPDRLDLFLGSAFPIFTIKLIQNSLCDRHTAAETMPRANSAPSLARKIAVSDQESLDTHRGLDVVVSTAWSKPSSL
jgi:hypothetical protein